MSSIDSLLTKGAKKNAVKENTKDKTPIINIGNSPELVKAQKTWREEKQKQDTAEAMKKQQEEILKPLALEAMENHCRKENKDFSSVKIQVGTETPTTLVAQNKYTDITMDAAEKLKTLFGNKFEQCFSEDPIIELSAIAKKNLDEVIGKIIKAVGGEEKFLELFDIKRKYKQTEYLHDNRLINSDISKLYKQAVDQQILKPYAPFFRA